MSRAQLKHLLLDVTFKDKPKIIDLEVEFKPIARLLLMDILAACSAATDAEISINVCLYLGNRIGVEADSVQKILDYCIKNDILNLVNNKITNYRVIEDQENYARKLETSNARVTRYRTKKDALQNNSETRTPDLDLDNDLNINIKEFDTPDLRSALALARARLRESGRDIDQIGLEALFMRFYGRYDDLIAALKHTATLTKAKNIYEPSPAQAKIAQKEPVLRRTINNYTPPSPEEQKPLTAEQRAKNKQLLNELNQKIKTVKSVPGSSKSDPVRPP